MKFLRLLCCILYTIYPVSGVRDERCVDDCSCCIDKYCGEIHFPNSCFKGCIDGHRGERCYELCQYKNCKSCGGDTHSEVCEECYDGYYLGENKDCKSPCPSNCMSCSSSTMCSKCKERFYNKNGSTTCPYVYCPANCECTRGQNDCISCTNGFYDTSTLCAKQCPVNCLTCESEKSCNECKSGFYNGYEYDKDINLQLNNCSYACRDTCTQCQSYNKCLRCINGKYGQTCQSDCSIGCKDKSCLFDSGHCECTRNFTGNKCTECIDGKYGLSCNKICSKYCKGKLCEKTSGDCMNGCKSDNITGNTCNTCVVGMYHELCNMTCSKNCRNRRCERYSGKCSEGCIGNFNGTMCDLCIDGKYGENCELDCPINCAEKHADDDGAGKTFIILFAVSVVIIIVQSIGLFILVKKRREVALSEANRQNLDVTDDTYENQLMSITPPICPDNETNLDSADVTTFYEAIDRAQDADGKYQQLSTTEATPEVYYNLNNE